MKETINSVDFSFFSTLIVSGSLAATARELGITTPAVSKRLSMMEARLNVTLINRTTRRMSLTPEGEAYLECARRILHEIDELEKFLQGTRQKPKGLLRVNATLGFGRSYVAPLVSRFVELYPEVDAQLQLSATPPPVSQDAYDVCVRFGPPPDTRVIAKFLGHNRRILCASPAYLKLHGEPKTPQELMKHNCITIRQGDEYAVWRFTSHSRSKNTGSVSEREQNVRIRGNLTTNDGEVAVKWALEGRGILLRAEWDVRQYIKEETLTHVLSAFDTPDADIYAVYPQQHRASTRVKTFVDFLTDSFDKTRHSLLMVG